MRTPRTIAVLIATASLFAATPGHSLGESEPNDTLGIAEPLVVPFAVDGEIDAQGDDDIYVFRLAKLHTYNVTIRYEGDECRNTTFELAPRAAPRRFFLSRTIWGDGEVARRLRPRRFTSWMLTFSGEYASTAVSCSYHVEIS